MIASDGLDRFISAQRETFNAALAELKAGQKLTHWMWFVFPQLAGLGRSATTQFYALGSFDEAREYLDHALLGLRLRQCAAAILQWSGRQNAEQILGPVDAMKLHSSMTLFDAVESQAIFRDVLNAFYGSEPDMRTLALLAREG